MEYLNLFEIVEDVKKSIKNHEYEYAKLQIEAALDSVFVTDELREELNFLSKEIDRLFSDDGNDFNESNTDKIFEKAFFASEFYPDHFMNWVYLILESDKFELNKKELETLGSFFMSEIILNNHKCLVLENLHFLKLNIDISYLNKQLKTVDSINTLSLDELDSFSQKKVIEVKLEDLAVQNPSALHLARIILNQVYTYCFPMKINFDNELLAHAIYDYVISKLEISQSKIFSQNYDENLQAFLHAILENKKD